MDERKLMFVIAGAAGSGKSTLAHALCENGFADVVYEADDFWYRIGNGKYAFNPKLLGTAHEWCQNRVFDTAYKGDKNIVVSNTNLTPTVRRTYFDIAELFGYGVVFIHAIGEHANLHGVPEDKVQKMRNSFVGLTEQEKERVVDLADLPSDLADFLESQRGRGYEF